MTEKNEQQPEDKHIDELPDDPWDGLLSAQSHFHNDLECITEMLSLVFPVLKNKDEERNDRLKEIGEEIKTEKGKGLRFNTAESLQEAVEHIKKITKGDRMFRQGIITTTVSKFDEFLIDVLSISYKENPNWIKNPDKKISYKEILEIESLDSLKDEIVQKEIESLMRDSHLDQIQFIDKKLKLGIEEHFPHWKQFLEITERRNLFVHTGGVVSNQYLENCRSWGIEIPEDLSEGKRLGASDEYIEEAIDCFYEISVRVVQAAVRRMFPDSLKDADRALNNPGVDLLTNERWRNGPQKLDHWLS